MIQEMIRIKELEQKMRQKIPVPTFFYVEKYGRKIEGQLNEILALIGKTESFSFRTDSRLKEEGLFNSFLVELEKHASLGKGYNGCVLIEWTEQVYYETDFAAFLTYIKEKSDKICFLFTMKISKDNDRVEEELKKYFFIRRVTAKEYETEELVHMITNICREFGYLVTDAAMEKLWEEMEKKEWKEEDDVACRIRNAVCEIVYDAAMEQRARIFDVRDAGKLGNRIHSETKKKNSIGFCRGGNTYE